MAGLNASSSSTDRGNNQSTGNRSDLIGNNTGNGVTPTNGRGNTTSLTGVAGLNLSSTSTNSGGDRSTTDRGTSSDVIGNNTSNGVTPTSLVAGDRSTTDNGASSSTLTGGLVLGLSSTSTNSGNNRLL